jgi:2'-5' RNA ligase
VEEKALYLVALFDAATDAALGGCYRVLQAHGFSGRQTRDIPYHLTLGSHEGGREAELCAQFERACREPAVIDLCLDHLGLFGLDVLFAEPNVNHELLDLQSRFFDQQTHGDHRWCAHATLLIDEPEVILRALPIVVAQFQPLHARIERVALYEVFSGTADRGMLSAGRAAGIQ